MEKTSMLDAIKGKLIVSCQALKDEPLHGGDTMAKMALAAEQGGAAGIRANGVDDIANIKKVTKLPIIGLVKRDYSDSNVYITPTKKEIDELIGIGVDMIALDFTDRIRPNGESLLELVAYMKQHHQLILADVSTVQEGLRAIELGADCISTTLSGYTEYTKRNQHKPDFELLKQLVRETNYPVIAEGMISSTYDAKKMLELGAHAVVVGSAITRPQHITKSFVDALTAFEVKS